MNLLKEQVEAVKQERLRREEQQRIQREADMEAEQVRARELELEQEFNLRLERAVQERVQERERRAAQETSPERRSAGRQDDGDDEVRVEADFPETTGRNCRGGRTLLRTGNNIPTALFSLILQQLGLSERRRPGWMTLLELARRGRHDKSRELARML